MDNKASDSIRLRESETFRQLMFIGVNLRLPTFEGFKKVNFCDTLQTICMKFNIWKYNHEQLKMADNQDKVIKAFAFGAQDKKKSLFRKLQ